jgi:RimJ/RimL family protein N-acetyltransferase
LERTPIAGTELRAVRDDDADGLIRLIAAAYEEYPGCVLDLPGVDDDLPAPATTAAARGGRWWVLARGEDILGSIGTGAVDHRGVLELKRCYLTADLRGRGLATRLIRRVEEHAAGLGAEVIELWSDTRFAAAHRRYQALGYERTGEERRLHDPSDTTEFRFVKRVGDAEVPCTATWDGPHGTDRAALLPLPDGSVVRGQLADLRYHVEVDAGWRPRSAKLQGPDGSVTLTSDGAGRWWQDGMVNDHLAGCSDAVLAVSPAAILLPTRRLALGTGDGAEVMVVVVDRHPEPLRALPLHYQRAGSHSWRVRGEHGVHHVEVAEDALPGDLGDGWQRRD